MTDLEHLIDEIPADYREVWKRAGTQIVTALWTRRDIVKSQEVIQKLRRGKPITFKEAGRLLGAVCGTAYMIGLNVQAAWSASRRSQEAYERIQAKAREERAKREVREERARENVKVENAGMAHVAREAARAAAREARKHGSGGATVA